MFEHNDRYLGIGCIVIGAFCFYTASGWSRVGASDPAGPDALPKILSVFFMVIGVILLLGSVLMKKQTEGETREAFLSGKSLAIIGLLAAICLAYILILPHIGYLFATPLLIACALLAVGERKPKTIILVSVIATLVLFVVFYFALQVKLPLGVLRAPMRSLGLAR